ncbi:MAG: YibE/F family protein [Patescibacteria group bacterium]|nr:YibE/F family protein [Patescibacteria group bacterium]
MPLNAAENTDAQTPSTSTAIESATDPETQPVSITEVAAVEQEVFEARVIEVLEERERTQSDGRVSRQQRLELIGLDGNWKDKNFEFNGIGNIDVVSSNVYKIGDRVLVQRVDDPSGAGDVFYIIEFVRRWPMLVLFLIFFVAAIIVGKTRGFRSMVSLTISAAFILYIILPLIIRGYPPLPIAIAGTVMIFTLMTYLTEGWSRKSHLASLSMLITMILVGLLAWLFTSWTRLTGTAQEETMFIIGKTARAIDFTGLLLSGILLGTMGAVDDIIIGQIEAVAQIYEANPKLHPIKVGRMSMEVGIAHMGAMTNTLFLAYASASLPLLMLFTIRQAPFVTFSQIINNEQLATEIVRTLVGSIGLVLAVPISTYLAARYLKKKTALEEA